MVENLKKQTQTMKKTNTCCRGIEIDDRAKDGGEPTTLERDLSLMCFGEFCICLSFKNSPTFQIS